jgi:ABC-type nickel/cobalt efflux system permease component RcnA
MADATPGSSTPSSNRNVMILLSYLWLLALIPLVVEKDDREVQWHAKHGLVLAVAELIFWVGDWMLRRDLRADHRTRIHHPAHLRDHQRNQRAAADHSRDQPVRGQVLTERSIERRRR